MSAVVEQALIWAVLISITLSGGSALVMFSCRRAAKGSLPLTEPNGYGWRGNGIKTPSTLRSEQTWRAGNGAAARLAPMYVLFNLAVVAALVAAAARGWRLIVAMIGGTAFVAWICLLIVTAVVASRAARAASDDPAGQRPAVAELRPTGHAAPVSGRTGTILGWICAFAACGLLLYLFGTIVDGYLLAIHHRLQPNSTFGFRDPVASSCLPRWYAAQRAGFTWMLFGYGTVLVTSLSLCAAVAIKRRSPWDICLLVLGTVLVLVVVLVPAGIHADTVARAVPC
ncbi:hypothetical protein MKCMC460_28540 [Mycobacterium sp. 20KCMC460]|uniref:SdpI family protein n=1 Tax=Mycobacterium kiyosense TaxID=2871094 RepID=A0A9P3PZP6_9MYCO|nr:MULTISPECIES: SdpI family protein [Mycobacterium]BDE13994.1 hypothetical protein MKCMC460_28540 [Mycobacterium sp. 20KCMC460]GLB81250.1 hypothetical protein SRL2020028_05060 [Mycobacterium kiyosense]GLB94586.1 hypothetical protein SRL2020226_13620 [Mycobacterium kiyosense]GLD28153.1 hypothetical protein Mkiyose1413_00360 [Mycobacterium kiyosense]GLD34874.1 hypothetical protein Mkiyose1595_10940 [Mycobacterium kiyosense]